VSGEPSPRKSGRWRRRVLILVLGLPVMGWLGTNLVIGSGWGRAKLAGKLEGMSGYEWSVGGAWWSPWGGVRLVDLEGAVPGGRDQGYGPLLLVEELRGKVYWGRLLRGELRLREVVVEGPRGEVPLELLAAMTNLQRPVQPPVVAEVPGPEMSPVPLEGEAGEKPAVTEEVAEEREPEEREKPDPGPPTRVVVREGSLRVFSEAWPEQVLRLSGFAADLPIGGPEEEGWMEIGKAELGGMVLVEGLRVGLKWTQPVLALPQTEVLLGGVPVQVRVQILAGKRMRMGAEVLVAPVEVVPLELPPFPGARVGAARVEAVGRFWGELINPGSWQGNLVAAGQGLVLENEGTRMAGIEYGRVAVDFRGGVLQVPDGRLMGESLSLLGNGAVRWDGQMLGVLRVVADGEYADGVTRALRGAQLSGGTRSWFAPMETPDRLYRDVRIEGAGSMALVDVGKDGGEMELGRAWQLARGFLRGEQGEAARGEPSSLELNPLRVQK